MHTNRIEQIDTKIRTILAAVSRAGLTQKNIHDIHYLARERAQCLRVSLSRSTQYSKTRQR